LTWFSSRKDVPPEILELLPKSDRLLAWAHHQTGLIAASDRNLVSISDSTTCVTPWESSLQAKWQPPNLTLITKVDSDSSINSQTWILDSPGQIPLVVRDRVTATVVIDRLLELKTAGRVRFIARRKGERIEWITLAEDDQSLGAESGASEVAVALNQLKAAFGI
jgi:hypothetical protein